MPDAIVRIAANEMATMMQYRVGLVLWGLGNALRQLIMLAVWIAAAGADGTVGSYDVDQLVIYFVATSVVSMLLGTDVVWALSHYIRSGKLAPKLLLPVHPAWEFRFTGYVVYGLQLLLVNAPVAAGLLLYYRPSWDVSLATIAWLVPIILLGQCLMFALWWMVACIAFWTQPQALAMAILFITAFVDGSFAPIALLPGAIGDVAQLLPFYWTLGFPSELLAGTSSVSDAPRALATIAGWFVVVLLVARVQWSRGLRRYSAVGA